MLWNEFVESDEESFSLFRPTTLQRSCTGSTCANPAARSGRSPADLPLQLYMRVCRWSMKGRHVHSAWLGFPNWRIEPAIQPRELEPSLLAPGCSGNRSEMGDAPAVRRGRGLRRGKNSRTSGSIAAAAVQPLPVPPTVERRKHRLAYSGISDDALLYRLQLVEVGVVDVVLEMWI